MNFLGKSAAGQAVAEWIACVFCGIVVGHLVGLAILALINPATYL